jgi:hypothetical protein
VLNGPPNIVAALLFALLAAASVTASPAAAQATQEDWQLLKQIIEAPNNVSTPEAARETQTLCVELGKQLTTRPDIEPAQRFYFEAEVEGCIAYAMNNGRYSDETGDVCSHHFAFASLLTESIRAMQNLPGVEQQQFSDMRDRLESASRTGEQFRCTSDYVGLLASLPQTDAIASTQDAGVPNEELMGRLSNMKYAITADRSDEWLAQCRQLEAEVTERSAEFHEVERIYFTALVEDCVAATLVLGRISDEVGDGCVHHHLFASRLHQSLLLDREAPFYNDDFRQYVQGELTVAMRQGPGMGCTQDYESLGSE